MRAGRGLESGGGAFSKARLPGGRGAGLYPSLAQGRERGPDIRDFRRATVKGVSGPLPALPVTAPGSGNPCAREPTGGGRGPSEAWSLLFGPTRV